MIKKWARDHDQCKECKTTDRKHHAGGLCVSCYEKQRSDDKARMEYKRQWSKKYQAENKEKIRQYNKQYREDNKEHLKQRSKQWAKENPEYYRKYYQEHKEQYREYGRKS